MRPPRATPSHHWPGHTRSWAPGTWSAGCQWWRHVQCSVWDTWHVTWPGCTRVQGTMATATSQLGPVSSYRSSVSSVRGSEMMELSNVMLQTHQVSPWRRGWCPPLWGRRRSWSAQTFSERRVNSDDDFRFAKCLVCLLQVLGGSETRRSSTDGQAMSSYTRGAVWLLWVGLNSSFDAGMVATVSLYSTSTQTASESTSEP